MTAELRPWETDWPEGCDMFIKHSSDSAPMFWPDSRIQCVLAPWLDPITRKLAAHVAHSFFTRKADYLLSRLSARPSTRTTEELNSDLQGEFERFRNSARVWALWGGI